MVIALGSEFCALRTLSCNPVMVVSASLSAAPTSAPAPRGGASASDAMAALRSYWSAAIRSATCAAAAGGSCAAAGAAGVGAGTVAAAGGSGGRTCCASEYGGRLIAAGSSGGNDDVASDAALGNGGNAPGTSG